MEVECLSLDIISSLPSTIIEIILCLVPIRDAVRTSILSRNWRYKWVTIPKLLLNAKDMFDKSNDEHQLVQPPNGRKQLTDKSKGFYAIYQVLLLHQGPIVEFSLSMKADYRCLEFEEIILQLSRKNTIKKLKLDLTHCSHQFYLPLSVFSLHQLTDLDLSNCELDLNLTFGRLRGLTRLSLTDVKIYPHLDLNHAFSGLGSLTRLSLINVKINRETFLHLISTSPLLKRLSLMLWDEENEGEILDFEIIELFKFLPVIEYLYTCCWTFRDFEYTAEDVVRRELPTALVYPKSLRMLMMVIIHKFHLLALFIFIRSSPNLEKIFLEKAIADDTTDPMDPEINLLNDYSDIWLEHLNKLEIKNFTNSKLELEFVKLILAKSPVLTMVRIKLARCVGSDEELKMLRFLIRCRRASPTAEIIVKHPKRSKVEPSS